MKQSHMIMTRPHDLTNECWRSFQNANSITDASSMQEVSGYYNLTDYEYTFMLCLQLNRACHLSNCKTKPN